MRTTQPIRVNVLSVIVAALWLATGSASAQNALGTGNALDANTRVGDKTNARARDLGLEAKFRNAIVTGNAGAGLSFRGDVGYRAADDFRSSSASDDNFTFRRDTAYSGLATLNIRGLSSVQNQFSLTTGGQTQGGPDGNLIVQRPSSGFVGSADGLKLDPFARIGGTLRSSSSAFVRDNERPNVLAVSNATGSSTEAGSRTFLVASGLQGVRNLNELNPAFGYKPRPVSGYQTADQIAEMEAKKLTEAGDAKPAGAAPEFISPYEAYRKQLGNKVSGPIDSSVDTLKRPTELNERERREAGLPAEPVRPEPATEPAAGEPQDPASTTFDQRMDKFRELLNDRRNAGQRDAATGTPGLEKPAEGEPGSDGTIRPEPRKDATETPAEARRRAREKNKTVLDEARELLADPETITTLRPERSSGDIFSEHMSKGQDFLAQGRWFDAEERFSAAISMQPGDPMAAAGRVHAQIAAGMYVSASVNLRNTLRAYPELIAARYDAKLLPHGERLERVRAQLRQRAERNTLPARDAALLLTYLGWQTGSEKDITDGLTAIDRVNETVGIDPDPLDAALRGAWSKLPPTTLPDSK